MDFYTDKETKVKHIRIYSAMTLCGILYGWTRQGEEIIKEKYGTTCEGCQDEVMQIKKLKIHENS